MQNFSEFFTFLDQCCDADRYLYLGEMCAVTGDCYGELRPMGAIYWFSIPFRMGLSPAVVLTTANLLLALISVVLSVAAVKNLLRLYFPATSRITGLIIFLASVIIHGVFLHPVIRFSLSDTPASLLILISIWLLLLSPRTTSDFISCALIGLCLGLAAWIRVFFLYPALVVVFFGVMTMWPTRKAAAAGLLLVFLPIAIQVFSTWSYTGSYSYLDQKSAGNVKDLHINSRGIGYDTLLPKQGYYWYSVCGPGVTLKKSLQQHNYSAFVCLIAARANFYLGSYSLLTYNDAGESLPTRVQEKNPVWGLNLLPSYKNSQGEKDLWHFINMQRIENFAAAPDGTKSAIALLKQDANSYGEISQTIMLKERVLPYEFSTWLWSSGENVSVNMAMRHHDSKKIIAEISFTASSQPEVKVLKNIYIPEPGLYDVVISSQGTHPGSSILIWEEFDLRQFMAPLSLLSSYQLALIPLWETPFRLWSPWILFANGAAFAGALLFLIAARKKLSSLQGLALILVLFSCAMAVFIIPEQRFAIVPMIFAWIIFVAGILRLAHKKAPTSG